MKEYLTLYDENGRDTGFVQQRGTGVCPGAYYQVVSIFTQDEAGLLLATRRSGQKVPFPHCWEVTGGCVQAGEDSHSAAARELEEETGFVPWKMEHLGSFSTPTFSGGAFFRVEVYGARVRGLAPALKMQEGEVEDYRWVRPQQLEELFRGLPGRMISPLAWKYIQDHKVGPADQGGNSHE